MILINEERCKGCGLCTVACPKKILVLGQKLNTKGFHAVTCTDTNACIKCAMCSRVCPDIVFEIYK